MIYRRLFDFPTWDIDRNFGELDRMRRQMGQLFDALSSGTLQGARSGVFPLTNLSEDKDNYYLHAELPGVGADELEINVTGKTISLAGERKIPMEENVQYHRRERESGKFSRIITLPGDVDPENVAAKMNNGVLQVAIGKAEAAKPRQIAVR